MQPRWASSISVPIASKWSCPRGRRPERLASTTTSGPAPASREGSRAKLWIGIRGLRKEGRYKVRCSRGPRPSTQNCRFLKARIYRLGGPQLRIRVRIKQFQRVRGFYLRLTSDREIKARWGLHCLGSQKTKKKCSKFLTWLKGRGLSYGSGLSNLLRWYNKRWQVYRL